MFELGDVNIGECKFAKPNMTAFIVISELSSCMFFTDLNLFPGEKTLGKLGFIFCEAVKILFSQSVIRKPAHLL